ncbi:MAG TPA: hypothetical protein V6C85_09205 [Allocoleopsis sp.]
MQNLDKILDILSHFHTERPTLQLFIPLFVIFSSSLLLTDRFTKSKVHNFTTVVLKFIKYFIFQLSFLLIFNYFCLVYLYTFSNNYIDHAEPNISAVSWLFQRGHSLYPNLDYPERYINNYGPIVYIINGFLLNLFQPSILTSKLCGAISVVITLLSLSCVLTKISGFRIAIIGSAYITLVFLSLNTFHSLPAASFWTRPDPLLLMCVSIALLAAIATPPLIATLIFALSIGISLNLKIFAILYFLPIYISFYQQAGLSYTLLSLFLSFGVAVTPFIGFSNISFENYITWLHQVSHQGLELRQFKRNIAWVITVSIPAIFTLTYLFFTNRRSLNQWLNDHKIYFAILSFSISGVVVIGSKPGAQENNLLPLIPALTYFFTILLIQAKKIRETTANLELKTHKYLSLALVSTILAWLVSALLIAIPNEANLIIQLMKYPNAIQDIEQVISLYPNTVIGMGYGKTYELSFYRPFLVFQRNSYLLDAASMMEMQQSGVNPIPSGTLAALKACQTEIWLIPKGEQPFQLASYYPPNKPLFSDRFRTVFLENYEPIGQTRYYDLWACKA